MEESGFRSGFIAILGRPNVGKSTLLNSILGTKLSIVTPRPQTTRNRILGVKNYRDSQMIFLDTPGVHPSKKRLNRYMVNTAIRTLAEVDVIALMTDVEREDEEGDRFVLSFLRRIETPAFLLINKIDLIEKSSLLPIIDRCQRMRDFREIIPVSAMKGINLPLLLEELYNILPPGPRYFPEGVVTDVPERFLAAEIIREKVMRRTQQEIPYSAAVVVERMDAGREGLMEVGATIYVERDSQKGIIIGRKGRMLKEIGTAARLELEALLGCQVFLDIWVKVKERWSENDGFLRELGFSEK